MIKKEKNRIDICRTISLEILKPNPLLIDQNYILELIVCWILSINNIWIFFKKLPNE